MSGSSYMSLCVRVVCPAGRCVGWRLSDCSVSGGVRDGRDGRWLPEALSPMWEGVRPALQPPAPHPNTHRRAAVPLPFLPLRCLRALPPQVPRRPPPPHRVRLVGGLATAQPPPPRGPAANSLVLASLEKIRRPGRSRLELDSRKRSHEARIRTPRGLLTRNHLHANFHTQNPDAEAEAVANSRAGSRLFVQGWEEGGHRAAGLLFTLRENDHRNGHSLGRSDKPT